MPRYWTLAEARAALPDAIALVEELRDLLRRGRGAGGGRPQRPTSYPSAVRPSSNGHGPPDSEPNFQQQARRVMDRIEAMGFQVKDVEAGLIDFPCQRGGEEVLLCFRLGEPDILFWHDLESGFAGRRPIAEL